MEELIEATKNNWKGYERLQAKVKNEVPKFGNDDDYVDEIAKRLMRDFEERVDEWNRKQERLLYCLGVGTFENLCSTGQRYRSYS